MPVPRHYRRIENKHRLIERSILIPLLFVSAGAQRRSSVSPRKLDPNIQPFCSISSHNTGDIAMKFHRRTHGSMVRAPKKIQNPNPQTQRGDRAKPDALRNQCPYFPKDEARAAFRGGSDRRLSVVVTPRKCTVRRPFLMTHISLLDRALVSTSESGTSRFVGSANRTPSCSNGESGTCQAT